MSTVAKRTPFDTRQFDLARLFDKLPPHAIEAEAALLGSMIIEWQVIGEVLQIIKGPEDFYKQAHAAIYQVLVDLYDKQQSLDMVKLKQRLADLGQLEEVGGLPYLLELASSVPSAASAAGYAQMVRDKAILRHLIETAGKIMHDAYNSAESAATLLNAAEQDIFRLAEFGSGGEASHIKALLHDAYERLEAREGQSITGLETGFYDLDEKLNGLQKGEMIIVAARPSMGKTAMALNIAEYIATSGKRPLAFFSLEMSKQQLVERMMCSRSGVDSQRLRRNMLNQDEFHALATAVGELSESPVYIDDMPGLTMLALRARARRLASRHDIEAVFIDYLQLMSEPGAESRQQEVSNMSRAIKALARELNVPVVCLSQLNRSPEGREGHRPRLSDLRESGSIEQDADVVLMLHREDCYHRGEEDYTQTHVAELIVAKQRNGPTGVIKFQFDEKTTRFHNLASGASYGDEPAPF